MSASSSPVQSRLPVPSAGRWRRRGHGWQSVPPGGRYGARQRSAPAQRSHSCRPSLPGELAEQFFSLLGGDPSGLLNGRVGAEVIVLAVLLDRYRIAPATPVDVADL